MTKVTDREVRALIAEFLAEHTVMALAVVGDDGTPHAASVMYAYTDDFHLYWVSDPTSRHSKRLAKRSECAVTIAGQYPDFNTIHGLQLHGHARRLQHRAAQNSSMRLLSNRYEFLRLSNIAAGLRSRLSKAAVYQFRPQTVTVIDNRLGFGTKHTLTLCDLDDKAQETT